MVTGASDGIGREFALQLAKAGFNVLIVARNREMLASLADEIASKYGVSVKIQLVDFSSHHEAAYQSLATVCEPLEIGVLGRRSLPFPNPPLSYSSVNSQQRWEITRYARLLCRHHQKRNGRYPLDQYPRNFEDDPDGVTRHDLKVNLLPLSPQKPTMTIYLRKRGLILNMGSFAGSVPSPMLATYSASKAFLTTFTAALADELESDGILVQHLNAFYVVSNMSKLRKPSLLAPLPSNYVSSVLRHIGQPCGAAFSDRPGTSTPYWSHSIVDYMMGLVGWKALFIGYTHGLHKSIRKRALRKMEKHAKKL